MAEAGLSRGINLQELNDLIERIAKATVAEAMDEWRKDTEPMRDKVQQLNRLVIEGNGTDSLIKQVKDLREGPGKTIERWTWLQAAIVGLIAVIASSSSAAYAVMRLMEHGK
jgi:hypothetical protein